MSEQIKVRANIEETKNMKWVRLNPILAGGMMGSGPLITREALLLLGAAVGAQVEIQIAVVGAPEQLPLERGSGI